MSHDVYTDDKRRALAAVAAESDLKKDTQTLLREIHDSARATIGPDERSAALANAAFAALLCRLGRKAEKQTRKIILLTWGLLGLTFVLAMLTAYLCYDAKTHDNPDTKANQTEQQEK